MKIYLEASGTAQSVVSVHNESSAAHSDLRTLITTAQTTASAAIPRTSISSATDSTSTDTVSNSYAVKLAYDNGTSARTLAQSKASVYNFSSTLLSTGWVGTSAPYTQAVTITGVTATDRPHVAPDYSSTNSTALLEKESWAYVCDVDSSANKLTFTCFDDKPTVDLNIIIQIVR